MLTALDARELAIALPIALSFQPFAYNIRKQRKQPPIELVKLQMTERDLMFAEWRRR